MYKSSDLCLDLVPTYSDFEEYNEKSFVGYKLAHKKNLNYYSIVTGHFRYKSGKIDKSSYSELYKKYSEYFNERLNNRLSIFVNKEDAVKSLEEFKSLSDRDCELVLLEIKISGELEKAKITNKAVKDKDVIIGNIIDNVKELKG